MIRVGPAVSFEETRVKIDSDDPASAGHLTRLLPDLTADGFWQGSTQLITK